MNENQPSTTEREVTNLPLPLSANDPLYAPHLQALAQGDLLIRQCASCSGKQWPPRPFCRTCQSRKFAWIPAPATGTIASYSIAYRAFHPAYVDHLPAATVLVDLESGIRIAGRWTGNIDDIVIGSKAALVVDEWAKLGVSAAWTLSTAV